MTPEITGACALILSGLALLLGQRNGILRAVKGFAAALLLLSLSSVGADIAMAMPETIQSLVPPALARILASAALLAALLWRLPRRLAAIDPAWLTWIVLAISEISSLAYRGVAFALVELILSGIAVIVFLGILAILRARRLVHRRNPICRRATSIARDRFR